MSERQTHTDGGDLKEAWHQLEGWYRAAKERAPKPCYETMDVQTKEQKELYKEHELPGELIPINVTLYKVEDEVPSDNQIREAVKESLKNERAEGASNMRGEDIKGWLRGIEKEEWDDNVHAEAEDSWRLFVQLVQTIWTT